MTARAAVELAVELQAPLPAHNRVVNHAAAELIEVMTSDCYAALVSATQDKTVRAAVAHLLAVLVIARDRRPQR